VKRELLLLRHGKSDWNTGVSDFNRPLKNRGKRAAQRMGVWLWQQGLRPDLVISSPAERAINTAHKCCKSMDVPVSTIIRDERIYAASLESLLTVLGEVPEDGRRIMLVGHNPGLEELLMYLAGDNVEYSVDGKLLPTATLAHLGMPDQWSGLTSGCATLNVVRRPRELPDGFPWPAPSGEEMRERPAYYYTQSAVIPYRIRDNGKAEYLVIGASSKNHWVVPKGIKEPELSPQESATREAWEEGGVRGEVEAERLGHYDVSKWGAHCSVDVYAMRVEEEVDEERWEESHRRRRWLPARKAADSLKQPELRAMLLALSKRLGK
jgi:phosphohistidine phosphatase